MLYIAARSSGEGRNAGLVSTLGISAGTLVHTAAVAHAAIEVGTPQIRNQGTVGGNLNQRPRCWYFRNEEFVCFKKGGNQCFSPAGENQFHAIFGGGPSFIVHPSSLANRLRGVGATFRCLGRAASGSSRSGILTPPSLRRPSRKSAGERCGASSRRRRYEAKRPLRYATGRRTTGRLRSRRCCCLNGATVRTARVVANGHFRSWRSQAAEQ
jgi:hypothetical protein